MDEKDFVRNNHDILMRWRSDYVERTKPLYPKCNNLKDYFALDGIMNKGKFEPLYRDKEKKLFWRWERKPSGEENQMWTNAPLRILYLTKDQNTDGCVSWDVRSESFRYPDSQCSPEDMYLYSQNTFYRNLVYSLYGILNTTHERKMEYTFTNQQALECADKNIFARINCKKEVGEARCSNNLLDTAIRTDSKFLEEQINNLEADIFVCCGFSETTNGTGNLMLNFLNTIGYDFKADVEKGSWLYYDEKKNKIAINSYHLSYLSFDYDGMINAYYEFLKEHPEFVKHR